MSSQGAKVWHDEERRCNADFVRNHAELEYREILAVLLKWWAEFNRDHFNSELVEPHIHLDLTAPRSLAHCDRTTGDGKLLQFTINARLVLDPTNPSWIVNRWPAPGTIAIVRDLVLRCTTRQYVLERRGAEESGHAGYGPLFAEKANEISLHLGLGPVVARHRGADTPEERWPVARFWPVNVRLLHDPSYYGNDVTQELLDRAAGTRHAARRTPIPPTLGMMEYFLFLLNSGGADRLRVLLAQQVDRLQQLRLGALPVLRQAELGKEDVDGSPLGTVTFNPAWLLWNNLTVSKMVEAIHEYRSYADLPILADALEDAGCADGRILRHLRTAQEHTYRCWVIQGLRDAAARFDQ